MSALAIVSELPGANGSVFLIYIIGSGGRSACQKCGRSYKHGYNLARHLRMGCGKEMSYTERLLGSGVPGPVTCPNCGNSYRHKYDLTRHKRNGCAKYINCPQCPFKSRYARDFDAHMRNHANPGLVHKCPFCPYLTQNVANVEKHVASQHSLKKK